jgi:RimJ/RimL family protein N-acetyltransferase
MTRFDIIETRRLLLRRWRDADREPFAELNGDPETLVFFPSTLTRSESDALADRIEARFEAHGYGLWALEVKQTGRFIGFTGLAPMQDDVPGAGGTEIGWRLARHAWHRGYATEAALAARDVAFTGAGLAELWSMTSVLNTPSQAVMRRIGMTEAARFEHPRIPDGSPLKPHVVYHLASPGAGELAPESHTVVRLPAEDACRGGAIEQGAAGLAIEAGSVADGHGRSEPRGHVQARPGGGDVGSARNAGWIGCPGVPARSSRAGSPRRRCLVRAGARSAGTSRPRRRAARAGCRRGRRGGWCRRGRGP